MEGTCQALTARQRPNMTYWIPELNEEGLGELMFTIAMAAHAAGHLYGVNPYIQPAVEKGKEAILKAVGRQN